MPYGQLQNRRDKRALRHLYTTPHDAQACRRILSGLIHCITVLFMMPIHETEKTIHNIFIVLHK